MNNQQHVADENTARLEDISSNKTELWLRFIIFWVKELMVTTKTMSLQKVLSQIST